MVPILRCLDVYDKTIVPIGCGKGYTKASVAVRSWHDSERRVGETGRSVHSLRTITEETATHVLVAHARETRHLANPGSKVGRGRFMLSDDHVPDWLERHPNFGKSWIHFRGCRSERIAFLRQVVGARYCMRYCLRKCPQTQTGSRGI